MKKLAVHLHLYYHEQLDVILRHLQNLDAVDYDLFVTMVEENQTSKQKLLDFNPNTKIWIVENRGYDVGPFVEFLHRIDLNQYELIMKIHTKNNSKGNDTYINKRLITRKFWFKLLIEALLGTKKIVLKNLSAFEKDENLGMIASKYLITSDPKDSVSMLSQINNIMDTFGFARPKYIHFAAGTMFMVRSRFMKKIKEHFSLKDFDITDGRIKDGTLSHILERIFGTIVSVKGAKIKGFDKNIIFEYQNLWSFLYRKKITNKGNTVIKICKIPVYHKKNK